MFQRSRMMKIAKRWLELSVAWLLWTVDFLSFYTWTFESIASNGAQLWTTVWSPCNALSSLIAFQSPLDTFSLAWFEMLNVSTISHDVNRKTVIGIIARSLCSCKLFALSKSSSHQEIIVWWQKFFDDGFDFERNDRHIVVASKLDIARD